jgi:hypothetical protein
MTFPDPIAFLQSHLGGVPGEAISLLSYINVDKAMMMIISAGGADRRQSGAVGTCRMITLITGQPGHGKTLRALQLAVEAKKEERAVRSYSRQRKS